MHNALTISQQTLGKRVARLGLDVKCRASTSKPLEECFFSFVFYCRTLNLRISLSRCKPNADISSLHACLV